jgi:phage terminase large subunit-like protein
VSQIESLIANADVEQLKTLLDFGERVSENRLEQEYFQTPDMDPDNGSPYLWQEEFHNNLSFARMLMCPNRVGKTVGCATEAAMHLTGLYPSWWQGHRFAKAIEMVAGAETNELSRNVTQKALLGAKRDWGTGWVPKDRIVVKPETQEPSKRQCGLDNVVDYAEVMHVSGKTSTVVFKTYEQGRSAWEGTGYDLVWLDEEPKDHGIFTEAMTRCADRPGKIMVSRTPLYGASHMVDLFWNRADPTRYWYKNIEWGPDTPHLTPEIRATLLAGYPEHERDVRTKGIPMMGEGLIYPVNDEDLYWEMPEGGLPSWYARIAGLDFGWNHPTAAVWLAWDRDADKVILYDCMRESFKEPVYHAAAIKARGDWIPVAWPHDGLNAEKSGGASLMKQYLDHGVKMLNRSARYTDEVGGGRPTEPVIQDLLARMKSGSFKVAKHLAPWFEEKRMYHRKNGKIVRDRDDLLSATHYGLMMLRCARTQSGPRRTVRADRYDPLARYDRGEA